MRSDSTGAAPAPQRAAVRATLLAASTLTVMAGATIAPSLPAMGEHFAGVANAEFWVRLVLTLPALLIAVSAPLVGMLVDRWGRRPVLVVSMVLYGVAGASGALAPSLAWILVGRALLGVAVAGVMTSITAMIADLFAGEGRTRFMGLQAAFMSLGGVAFLLAGGALAAVGWRLPFLIYLCALVLLLPVVALLREPAREAVATASDGSVAPVVAPRLWFLYAVALFGMIAFYMVPVQVPFLLEALTAAGPAASGAAIAAATLSGALASVSYARVRHRLDPVQVTALVFALFGAGYVVVGTAGGYAQVVAGLLVSGLGAGLLMPNLNVWLTSVVAPAARGRALGGMTTALFLGQFLSPIAVQPVVAAWGLGRAFLLTGLTLGGIAVAVAALRGRIARATAAPAEGRDGGVGFAGARSAAVGGAPEPGP